MFEKVCFILILLSNAPVAEQNRKKHKNKKLFCNDVLITNGKMFRELFLWEKSFMKETASRLVVFAAFSIATTADAQLVQEK